MTPASLLRKPKLHFDTSASPSHVTFDDAKESRRNLSWQHYIEAKWDYAEPDVLRVEIGEWLVLLRGHNLSALFQAIEDRQLSRVRAQPNLEQDLEREIDSFATEIRFLKPPAGMVGKAQMEFERGKLWPAVPMESKTSDGEKQQCAPTENAGDDCGTESFSRTDEKGPKPFVQSSFGNISVSTGAASSPGPMCSLSLCAWAAMMTEKRIRSDSCERRMASFAMVPMSWQIPDKSWPGFSSALSMMAQVVEVQAKGCFKCCLIESILLKSTRTPSWMACLRE